MLGTETDHNDDSRREEIVFGTTIDWEENRGGLERIGPLSDHMDHGIDTDTFAKLIEGGYVDPEETQNGGPTMQELLEFGDFAEAESEAVIVEYTGYMISPDRPDSRITITGIKLAMDGASRPIPDEIQDEFLDRFRKADEFTVDDDDNFARAWWD